MEITLEPWMIQAAAVFGYIVLGLWAGRWSYREVKRQWSAGNESCPPPAASGFLAFVFWPLILPTMIIVKAVTFKNEP